MYYIYKITSPSGKVYIGQTKNLQNRLAYYKWLGKRLEKQPKIFRSLKKYGWKNHTFEILLEGLSKNEANEKEIENIEIYMKNNISLNCTKGGNNVSVYMTIPIIQLDLDKNFIKRYESTQEASIITNIKHQSINHALKNNNYAHGYLWIYESEYLNNKEITWDKYKSPRVKEVIQYNFLLNEINRYKNPREASEKTGVKKGNILVCLSGQTVTAGGFIWRYENFYYKPIEKTLTLLDFEGNLIKEFKSIAEASRFYNISQGGICDNINGKIKKSKLGIWKYKMQTIS